jgi:hypothetical protein
LHLGSNRQFCLTSTSLIWANASGICPAIFGKYIEDFFLHEMLSAAKTNPETIEKVVGFMRMRMGTMVSMLAGAGIGAAAVGLMRFNRGENAQLKKMANDYLKNETNQQR